jgi:hypothetical protein
MAPAISPPAAQAEVAGSEPNNHKPAHSASAPVERLEASFFVASRWRRLADWLESTGCWAWMSSAAVHATILIALSLVILSAPKQDPLQVTSELDAFSTGDVQAELSEIPAPAGEAPSLGPFQQGDEISMPGARAGTIGAPGGTSSTPSIGGGGASTADFAFDPLAPIAAATPGAGGFESLSNPLASRGGGLEGRTLENRRALALAGGGSPQSESAVEAALAWFAEHQYPDGGWRFDFTDCPNCHGYCRNPGRHTSTTAATGLALLSFLGAGYTHQDGKYQEVVERGLYYLQQKMTVTSHGGDLRDRKAAPEIVNAPAAQVVIAIDPTASKRDSMYSHGIASLALVEAYAMTHDKGLRQPAEQAVKFIIDAQYADGGWRYDPGFEAPSLGDATVSGWQITVLKSATLAGIDVPYDVWMKIREFLDSIQDDGGSTYLYRANSKGTAATTAIGLLCRMVTGWPKDHAQLLRGVAKLGGEAPQRHNMYYNFYASQVLHHIGGPNWDRWNPKMREYLIKSQARDGHEIGSWYFDEEHASIGGRLYITAMAAMTLEVYYRHMPLYQEAFVDGTP